MAVELTKDDVDLLQEVMFAISTPNADPVSMMTEYAGSGAKYTTPDGFDFTLTRCLDEATFEGFASLIQRIEDAVYATGDDHQ